MHPTLVRIGDFRIATYGVLVAAAYLAGILWLRSERERMGLEEERLWRIIYCLFFGAVAGGKLLFVLLNWEAYASGEMGLLRDFRYGFVFFGGLVGAVLAGAAYALWTKADYLRLADYFVVALPLGHAVGRLGCLSAGCCHGRPAPGLPWAVRFTDPGCLVEEGLRGVPLHPVQVYEALGCLAIAALLHRALRGVQAGRLREGTAFAGYLTLYAALRFAVEFYRGDDRGGFWLGLSPSQWIAAAAAAAAGVLLTRRGIRPARA